MVKMAFLPNMCCLIIINKQSLLKYLYFDMWRDYYIKADYNNL